MNKTITKKQLTLLANMISLFSVCRIRDTLMSSIVHISPLLKKPGVIFDLYNKLNSENVLFHFINKKRNKKMRTSVLPLTHIIFSAKKFINRNDYLAHRSSRLWWLRNNIWTFLSHTRLALIDPSSSSNQLQ